MKALLKELMDFLLSVLKGADWKAVLHKLCVDSLLPELKKLVEKSDSKVDDVIYQGIEKLVEVFLKPGLVAA